MPDNGGMTTRLNKFIAETGFCSRREADRLIAVLGVAVKPTAPPVKRGRPGTATVGRARMRSARCVSGSGVVPAAAHPSPGLQCSICVPR